MILEELSLKNEIRRIRNYLLSIHEEQEFRWIKQLINKIGIKDFNLTFASYSTSLNPDYIDLDSAFILYQELFE